MYLSVTQKVVVNDWLFTLFDAAPANHQDLADIVLTSPLTDAVNLVSLDID